jgi:hypothetical protein
MFGVGTMDAGDGLLATQIGMGVSFDYVHLPAGECKSGLHKVEAIFEGNWDLFGCEIFGKSFFEGTASARLFEVECTG